jgi:hypothetical protein
MIVDIDSYAEGAIILDGFNDAIVGITEEFGGIKRLLYSKYKILEILQENNPMTQSEAEEYYDYNIVGLYAGDQNPIFLDLEIIPIKMNENYEYKIK